MDHKTEAEILAERAGHTVNGNADPRPVTEVIALGQLHAALYLADRIDMLISVVIANGRK